jgi:hypothetical protein
VQLRLTANLSPGQRILAGMQAQAFAMASLRGTLRRKFPEISQAELNMKVLAQLTPVRMTAGHRPVGRPTPASKGAK